MSFPELGIFWVSVWIWHISRQWSLTTGHMVFVLDLTYSYSAFLFLSYLMFRPGAHLAGHPWYETVHLWSKTRENIFAGRNQHFASFPCVNKVNKKKSVWWLCTYFKNINIHLFLFFSPLVSSCTGLLYQDVLSAFKRCAWKKIKILMQVKHKSK